VTETNRAWAGVAFLAAVPLTSPEADEVPELPMPTLPVTPPAFARYLSDRWVQPGMPFCRVACLLHKTALNVSFPTREMWHELRALHSRQYH
jgi:hypothetical protein